MVSDAKLCNNVTNYGTNIFKRKHHFKVICLSYFTASGYEAIKNWHRKDIFAYDLTFVPVHSKKRDHWSLASINLAKKCLSFYDSYEIEKIESSQGN